MPLWEFLARGAVCLAMVAVVFFCIFVWIWSDPLLAIPAAIGAGWIFTKVYEPPLL